MRTTVKSRLLLSVPLVLVLLLPTWGQHTITGTVLDEKNQAVQGAEVISHSASGEVKTQSDNDGRFSLRDQTGSLTLSVSGKYIISEEQTLNASDPRQNLQLHIRYAIGRLYDKIIITATALDPVSTAATKPCTRTLFSIGMTSSWIA
jgi:hypothetical protein